MKKLKTYKTFLIWIAKQCSEYDTLDEKDQLEYLKKNKHSYVYDYGIKCAKHNVFPVWDIQ